MVRIQTRKTKIPPYYTGVQRRLFLHLKSGLICAASGLICAIFRFIFVRSNEERFKPITDNELAERTRLEATSISSKIARELMGALQAAFAELEKDTADRGVDHSSFMAGLVCEIRSELDDIVTRFDIPDMVTEHTPPAWLNENNTNNNEER